MGDRQIDVEFLKYIDSIEINTRRTIEYRTKYQLI